MKAYLAFLFIIASVAVSAQVQDTLVLQKISKADVRYETKEAILFLSKENILKDAADFNEQYSFPDASKKKEWDAAIRFLKSSKRQIELVEKKEYQQKELNALSELVRIRIGASLLNKKKAEVVRKVNNEKQSNIVVRPLIGSSDGSVYLFYFMDGTEAFYGEVFGEIIFYLEN
jgi:hypothetical protein